MMRVPDKEMKIIWAVSAVFGILLFTSTFLITYYLDIPSIFQFDELIILTSIVVLIPPALAYFFDDRWKSEVDRRIPEFLGDLSQAGRTGVTLIRGIELSAKRNYGPLSKHLNRIITLLSWGRSLEDALKEFADDVDTRLARRTSVLIQECNRSGGNIQEILDVMSRHITELYNIDRERKSMIRPYIGIIYIAFFIFIAIDIMLVRTFFAQMQSLQESMAETGGMLLSQSVKMSDMQRNMFHLIIIEGFFGGLIAGKMGEASVTNGLKHSLIMMILGLAIFYLVIWHPII
ncbi:MAG: type II secretion system F family protein [Methanocellales archaeon]|nr:type II secretion system F family protein [Methanocellales archaeon]